MGTGQCKQVFQGHRSWVLSICVWGDRIYSGSQEPIVRVWDIKSGECISALEGHADSVQHVVIALPDSERKKKKDGTPSLSDTAAQSPAPGNEFHLGSGELFTASKDKSIKVWDLKVFALLLFFLVVLLTLNRQASVSTPSPVILLLCIPYNFTREQFLAVLWITPFECGI